MTGNNVDPVLGMSIILGLGLLLFLLFWLIRYRVGRHEVEVVIFKKVVLRKVMLGDIDDVILGVRFPCEFWPNSWLFQRRFLTIRRKKGLIRYLVITPPRPAEFRANLFYVLGWNPEGIHGQGPAK